MQELIVNISIPPSGQDDNLDVSDVEVKIERDEIFEDCHSLDDPTSPSVLLSPEDEKRPVLKTENNDDHGGSDSSHPWKQITPSLG